MEQKTEEATKEVLIKRKDLLKGVMIGLGVVYIIALGITTDLDVNLRTAWSKACDLSSGDYEAIFSEDDLLLSSGTYNLIVGLSSNESTFQYLDNIATINISDVPDPKLDKSILRLKNAGLLLNPMTIKISPL